MIIDLVTRTVSGSLAAVDSLLAGFGQRRNRAVPPQGLMEPLELHEQCRNDRYIRRMRTMAATPVPGLLIRTIFSNAFQRNLNFIYNYIRV